MFYVSLKHKSNNLFGINSFSIAKSVAKKVKNKENWTCNHALFVSDLEKFLEHCYVVFGQKFVSRQFIKSDVESCSERNTKT